MRFHNKLFKLFAIILCLSPSLAGLGQHNKIDEYLVLYVAIDTNRVVVPRSLADADRGNVVKMMRMIIHSDSLELESILQIGSDFFENDFIDSYESHSHSKRTIRRLARMEARLQAHQFTFTPELFDCFKRFTVHTHVVTYKFYAKRYSVLVYRVELPLSILTPR
jgi:hypothetical protein